MKTRRRHIVPFRYFSGVSSLILEAVGLAVAAFSTASAQMHHVDAQGRVTRAIGVYEWTGDLSKPTAARFVPVSLFIDGRFEDAGLYLARPVPLALQPGDIYALERSGEPQGLLDLNLAHRVVTGKALADDNTVGAWYGYGRFTPEIAPKAAPLKASSHLSKLEQSAGPNTPVGAKLPSDDNTDSRPHMTRRDGSAPPANTGSGTGSSGSSGPAGGTTTSTAGTGSGNSSNDDTDRPTLRRRDPSQDATRRRDSGSRNKTASVTAAGPALGDDPDRPILGHNSGEGTETPELTGLPINLHQAVAVSDAAHSDNHPFARGWDTPAERADTLIAMAALARTRLVAYMAANQLVASNSPLPTLDMVAATAPAQAPSSSANAGGPKLYDDTPDPSAPKLQRGVPQQGNGGSAPNAKGATTGSSSASASTASTGASTAAASPARQTAVHPPAGRTSAHPAPSHSAAGHPAPLTLAQEEVSGFTLSYGGLPTFVYTAAAPVKKAGTPGSPGISGPQAAYVTVVAQRLASGELQVALSAATDSAHLDRGSQLRLVDAVDPDDSHRASLLFELRGGSSRQFVLYRLTSARAEQTFATASIE